MASGYYILDSTGREYKNPRKKVSIDILIAFIWRDNFNVSFLTCSSSTNPNNINIQRDLRQFSISSALCISKEKKIIKIYMTNKASYIRNFLLFTIWIAKRI